MCGFTIFSSSILTNYDNDDDEQTIPLIKYLLSVFIPPVYFLSCSDVFPPLQDPPYVDLTIQIKNDRAIRKKWSTIWQVCRGFCNSDIFLPYVLVCTFKRTVNSSTGVQMFFSDEFLSEDVFPRI